MNHLYPLFLILGAMSGHSGEPPRPPVIDMHLHAYTDADYWGQLPSPFDGTPAPETAEAHHHRSSEMMRRYNVVLGAVSGETLEAAARWHAADPDRVLRALEFGHPERGPGLERVGQAMVNGELQVLGEVTAQYHGLSPSDPRFDPYWALAEEHGIPVGIHTGQSFSGTPYHPCCPDFRLKYGSPLLLEEVLVKYPRLKVYMMHAGGYAPFGDQALMMMAMYPQLHADISVLNWLPDMEPVLEHFLRQARQMGLLDRVLFGSDQMVWPEAIGIAIERIEGLVFLTEQEKRDILYFNAARFLDLSEEEIARHHGR
jgi:uncharacterized protein